MTNMQNFRTLALVLSMTAKHSTQKVVAYTVEPHCNKTVYNEGMIILLGSSVTASCNKVTAVMK